MEREVVGRTRPSVIPGQPRYRVTTTRVDGSMSNQVNLSASIAESTMKALMRVIFLERNEYDDDSILSVKLERQLKD